jgi:hypothetical protein
MPAITVGFEEFETRLDRVRKRLHLLALTDAVCIAGSAALLAGSAIIVAAFATGPEAFAWIARLATAAAVAALAVATWRLWNQWPSLYETALYVDRKAGLDARVATMLAHPTSQARSPLRSMLLWEVFDLAPRWDVDRIAPLRIGRPAIALAIALVIFLAAALLAPDPEPEPPPEIGNRGAPASSASVDAPGGRGGNDSGTKQSQGAALDGEGSTISPFSGDRSPGDSPDTGQRGAAGGLRQAGNRDDRGRPSTAEKPATDLDPDKLGDLPEPPKAEDLKPAAAPAADQKVPKAPRSAPEAERQKQRDAKRQKSPSERDRPAPGKKGGSKATSANPRRGETGGTRGLLAEKGAKPLPSGKAGKPMVIQLKAFAVQPAEQLEPQGRPSGEDGAPDREAEAVPAPVASSQAEDSLLQRSVVTRVHQDLIRELFTPEQR